MRKFVMAACATLAFSACSSDDPVVCLEIPSPAISVAIKDSVSGNLYTGSRTVVVNDGVWTDSVTADGPSQIGAVSIAHDRPGIYTVIVRTGGIYQEWKQTGVVATQAACGMNTAHVVALLQRPPKDTTSDFAAWFYPRGAYTASMVRVRFTAGSFQLDLGSAELGKQYKVPTSGDAQVRYSLLASATDTIATKVVSLSLQPSYTYGIAGTVAPTHPLGCFGFPLGVPGLPLRNTTDSLFVDLGAMPKGAVC